jgi:hypothetical protein
VAYRFMPAGGGNGYSLHFAIVEAEAHARRLKRA